MFSFEIHSVVYRIAIRGVSIKRDSLSSQNEAGPIEWMMSSSCLFPKVVVLECKFVVEAIIFITFLLKSLITLNVNPLVAWSNLLALFALGLMPKAGLHSLSLPLRNVIC